LSFNNLIPILIAVALAFFTKPIVRWWLHSGLAARIAVVLVTVLVTLASWEVTRDLLVSAVRFRSVHRLGLVRVGLAEFHGPSGAENRFADELFAAMEDSLRSLPDLEVVPIRRALASEADARLEGSRRGLDFVWWGWFDRIDSVIVDAHLTKLRIPAGLTLTTGPSRHTWAREAFDKREAFKSLGHGVIGVSALVSGFELYGSNLMAEASRCLGLALRSGVLADYPSSLGQVWLLQANALGTLGRYQDSFAAADSALRADSTIADAWQARATAAEATGRQEEVLSSYDRVLRLSRDSAVRASAYSNRASALMARGRIGEALGDADSACALTPKSEHAHYMRSCALWLLGRTEESDRALETAIASNPRWGTPIVERARRRAIRGDGYGAIADLTNAIESARSRTTVGGRGLLENVGADSLDVASLLFMRAQISARLNRREDAIRDARLAATYNPTPVIRAFRDSLVAAATGKRN
jgi:tetratricopeptide (TPR) repeat protein